METTFKSELLVLPLDKIAVSKTNPRKTFDEAALAELSLSIKEHGVLQPILVRPMNGTFELVCGERRFRAATMAGLLDIPTNIRELSDDEAFELQIIENLERKDVHPLEEAEAFSKMLECGRYKLPDIAAKMAKTETFIAQRLKLNDLIPEIKQDFLHNDLSIGHAVHIARLDVENQEGIYKFYKNNYSTSGYGTVKQLIKEIDNKKLNLKKAIFPLDTDFKYAKACTSCSFRSSNNPGLFPDMENEDNCFNKNCFNTKKTEHLENEITDLLQSNKPVLLAKIYGDVNSDIVELTKKMEVPILKIHDDFNTTERSNAKKRKVFYVNGEDAGKIKSVWVYDKAAETVDTAPEVLEIKKIETRAERALELDQEKIHKEIIKELRPEVQDYLAVNFKMDPEFINSMFIYFAMENMGFYYLESKLKRAGIEFKPEGKSIEDIHTQIKKFSPEQKQQLMVFLMFNKASNTINDNDNNGKMVMKLAAANKNIPVARIKEDQDAKAQKRILRTKERLHELKTKAK